MRVSLADFMTPTTRNYRISKRNFPGGTERNLDRQTHVKGCLSTIRGRCEIPTCKRETVKFKIAGETGTTTTQYNT